MPSLSVRIGTRSSALALWQATHVADHLGNLGVSVELVRISTSGDRTTGSIASSGEVGIFTKELQRALLDGRIDIAVHSLKDLPTLPAAGLTLAAVPLRGSIHDALITPLADSIAALPDRSRVGTASPRRKAQLLRLRPDLEVVEIRGNVDTRLRKLDSGEVDVLILAAAGLERLGLAERIAQRLSPADMLPAPAQGALGIECRGDDAGTIELLQPIHHRLTYRAVTAEREMLRIIEAGCHSAAAGWCRQIAEDRLRLDAAVLSPDGFHPNRCQRAGSAHRRRGAWPMRRRGADGARCRAAVSSVVYRP